MGPLIHKSRITGLPPPLTENLGNLEIAVEQRKRDPIAVAVQRRLPLAARHAHCLPLRIDHPKLLAPSRQIQRRFFLNLQPESDPRLSAFISGQDRFVEVSSSARAQGLGPLMNADFDFHGVRYPFAPHPLRGEYKRNENSISPIFNDFPKNSPQTHLTA